MFNKKLIVGLFTVILMTAPFTTKAVSTQELQAQISQLLALVASLQQQLAQQVNPTNVTPIVRNVNTINSQTTQANILGNSPIKCETITRNLWQGVRGTDVSQLQSFLKSTGDYTYPTITSYYGPATVQAVQRYQSRMGIVSYGTPNTTGYGVVGPKTRDKMGCGGKPSTTIIPTPIFLSYQLNVDVRDVAILQFPSSWNIVEKDDNSIIVRDPSERFLATVSWPIREIGYGRYMHFEKSKIQSGNTEIRKVRAWGLNNKGSQSGQLMYFFDGNDDFFGQSFEVHATFKTFIERDELERIMDTVMKNIQFKLKPKPNLSISKFSGPVVLPVNRTGT